MFNVRKFLLFFFSLSLFTATKSFSTLLVNPAGAGGFELGNTFFAANGWTLVNGAQTNKWWCNTPANPATPSAGTNCAYISNNGAGTTYNYSTTNTSVVHFYRDIAIPAGENNLTISFDWKGFGEAGLDYIQVFLVPTTTTPVAGSLIAAVTGTQVSGNLNSQSNWITATIGVDCSGFAGTTRRLVFTWVNDNSGGTQGPGAIDNISVVSSASITCTYSISNIPYITQPFAGTSVILGDDQHSPVVPIGFTFCYYGINYSQLVISSNAYLSFNLANAGTFSPWSIPGPIPLAIPAEVVNSIMGPWFDPHPGLCVGACVFYQTIGAAPNRVFVTSYLNVPMFSCTTRTFTGQIMLYETTNIIEVHIGTLVVCAGWNNGWAIEGLNPTCTSIAVPGRNASSYVLNNDGIRFTPTCCLRLPVDLISFDAKYNSESKKVNLSWATASETNCDYYSVEKSTDGENFSELSKVKGAGNSSSTRNYTAIDPMPSKGVQYYRLRQVDFDGVEHYSQVDEVNIKEQVKGFMIIPNPAHKDFEILFSEFSDETLTLSIYNAQGKKVKSEEIKTKTGVNKKSIDAAGFEKGLYHVVLISDDDLRSEKLVIN